MQTSGSHGKQNILENIWKPMAVMYALCIIVDQNCAAIEKQMAWDTEASRGFCRWSLPRLGDCATGCKGVHQHWNDPSKEEEHRWNETSNAGQTFGTKAMTGSGCLRVRT